MRSASLFQLTGLLCGVSASPAGSWSQRSSLHVRNDTGTACAEVSASAAAALSASPSATPTVGAQLAYNCLNSVPLHQEEALELYDALLPYVEWQSTIEYLKDPPEGYTEPAVDIRAELAELRENLVSGGYENEYKFQADLWRRFNLAHDGHFRFFPDLLTGALRFSRNVGLVSVSLDGSSIPDVYEHNDISSYVAGNSSTNSSTPSPVTTINGQDAVTFLKDFSQLGALNDPDALYNAVFFSKPFAASTAGWNGYFSGSGRFGYLYPGTNTTLGFKNGTSRTYTSTAGVIGNFTGVTDGESAYQKFCTGPAPEDEDELSEAPPAAPAATPAPGYPVPDVISSDHLVSGYFLNSTRNSDVAVLSMLSFAPNLPSEFQAVIQQFLANAKAAGKKKIVIDVSANGGGYILNGYDAYRQFFPQIQQEDFTRFRYTEALRVMAEQYARVLPYNLTGNEDPDTINAYESFVDYHYDYNINLEHFKSVKEKIGPNEYNNDNFTSIIRWDLNDPLTTVNTTFGIGMEITGYGTRKNFTQPFAAEDIIIFYDGYCASTCTLFSEFMRLQGGVKSIAMGGRPSKDPMQGIGGVKGANNAGFDYLNYLAQYAYQSGTPEQQQSAEWEAIRELDLKAYNRATDTSLNLRDNILKDDLDEGLPNQFVYEKADCRLYYEPSMITDVSNIWEAAADAAWGDKQCVEGSLGGYKKRSAEEKRHASFSSRAVPRMRLPKGEFKPLEKDTWWNERHDMRVPK